MEKLDMQTKDLANENFEKLKALFPNAITETIDDEGILVRAIDKDILMQEISTEVVEGREDRYQFTWPDKRQAIATANAPISKTLRPSRVESVNFDETENLYIEGDNLEVLKLLQETYLGKIKMIYIDPPYNTGSDFVYNDNFSRDKDDYLEDSGQFDEDGNRLEKNLESNGRFHTDWLNMMFPRLKLARNLLKDDGAIYISIDSNELINLSKICDEIFGASNRLGILSVVNNLKGRSDDNFFATSNEFLLVYAKNKNEYKLNGFELSDEEYEQQYDKQDEISYYKTIGFRKTGNAWERSNRPYMYYPVLYKENVFDTIPDEEFKLIYNPKTQEFDDEYVEELKEIYTEKGYEFILPLSSEGEYGRWRWGRDTFHKEKDYNLDFNNSNTLCTKMRAILDDGSIRSKSPKTIFYKPEYDTGSGARILKKLFENSSDIFDNPKSLVYISDLIHIATNRDDIILDFFSGSSTTAHATMQLNADDRGKRKYIMVQLPEKTDLKSEAFRSGYNNICEIGKERIRRAGDYILKRNEGKQGIADLDIGFRVLKIDSSNMKDVYYAPAQTEQSLLDLLSDNIKEDRTPEDLLFQVMLDLGVSLSSKIEREIVDGKEVFNVEDGFLIACFDKNINEETVKAIANKDPYYAMFRDSSMANDSVATNFEQIFESISPQTVRKVI